jgi:ATP-dependent Clp protease ATP-binding subunit ClpC
MLRDREIEVRFTDTALDWLAERGFDPDFGARPLKRVFQREVQDRLATVLLDGSLKSGAPVTADLLNDRIVFRQ